jgi:EAL domain-containing protein (putative c-di-GMP-specific phosphodiesterase class I)
LPAERFEFEITEGVLLEETERNLNSLRELKHMGISIALDDFGVGYSSLAYLTKFPFDKVKIDKSFIDALDRTETSAVISSIVELAKSLNLAILAEGIETEDQRKRVRSLGIKFGQGFLFAEPMPLDRLIAPSRWRRWSSLTQADGKERPPRAGVTGAVRLAQEGQRQCEALASLAPPRPRG